MAGVRRSHIVTLLVQNVRKNKSFEALFVTCFAMRTLTCARMKCRCDSSRASGFLHPPAVVAMARAEAVVITAAASGLQDVHQMRTHMLFFPISPGKRIGNIHRCVGVADLSS